MDPFQPHSDHEHLPGPGDPFLGSLSLNTPATSSVLPSSSLEVQIGPAPHSCNPLALQAQSSSNGFALEPLPTLSTLDESSVSGDDGRSILGMLDPRPRGYSHHKVFDLLTGAGRLQQSQVLTESPTNRNTPTAHSLTVDGAEDLSPHRIEPPSSSMIVNINPTDLRYHSTIEADEPVNSDDDSGSPSPSLIRHHPLHASPRLGSTSTLLGQTHPPSTGPPLHQSILHEHRSSTSTHTAPRPYPDPLAFLARARDTWNQERARYARHLSPDGHIQLANVDDQAGRSRGDHRETSYPRTSTLSPREIALWRWVNVDDLDAFLQEVYTYYCGKGIWAIALARLCNLM